MISHRNFESYQRLEQSVPSSKKNSTCQPKLQFPAKSSAMDEGERKIIHDTNGLKEFMSVRPYMQRILEAILQVEEMYK